MEEGPGPGDLRDPGAALKGPYDMKRALTLILCVSLSGLLAAQTKVAVEDLPEQYRDWLDLVHYIIQPVERDVFLKLTNNRDRDIFIETFWRQRDPTPGTPENEYRDEILRRFQHVNKFFGRATVRRGWQTDMGRIYMILGEPASIERFETSSFVVPCQAWTYYGDPRKGLPNMFIVLFYQRGSIGEFRLYDPLSDGPARLLMNKSDIDPFDYQDLYMKIREIAPTLADLSLSMIPGEYSFDFSPSPRNAMIMADIFQSPKRDVNVAYATHFLDYRGFVSTEYMTNFVESESMTALVHDPMTGLRFLHFTIVPKSVTMEFYEPKNQHYCNFQINASLRVGEDIVFQYTREFPFYFADSEADRIRANGIAIEDSFPVAAGTYRLIVLLTNTVGKEFTIFEKDLTVPADTGEVRIDGPFLGYRFETFQRDIHLPFKVLDRKLVVDPKNTFGTTDDIAVLFNVMNVTEDLRQGGEARILIRGMRPDDPVTRSFTVRLAAAAFGNTQSVFQTVPARDLAPDYYEILVSVLASDGRILDEKKDVFVVSPSTLVPHPIAQARGFALANRFIFYYMLAEQAEKTGRWDKAEALYKQALDLNPDHMPGVVRYVRFLLKTQAFGEALTLVERLREDDNRRFEYLSLKGKAFLGLEKFGEALKNLVDAAKIYNSDIEVLNAMGVCYRAMGRMQEARETFEASLKLNPEQPDIKKIVEGIRK